MRRKTHEEKVEWQNGLVVYFLHGIHQELKKLRKEIKNMPSEVVTQLNSKFDQIEQTLRDEAAEIQEAIAAASSGGATPEEVAALEARADGINAAIEALVTNPTPPTP